MFRPRWFLTLVVAAASGIGSRYSIAEAQATFAPKPLRDRLSTNDFWTTTAKQAGVKWSEDDLVELRKLANGDEPVLRLRANKLLADANGTARLNAGDDSTTIAVAAFQFLESHLDNPSVKDLCVKQGFTHYHVSRSSGDEKVFLIERVGRGFNGGINLRWNDSNQTFSRFEVWGDVAL